MYIKVDLQFSRKMAEKDANTNLDESAEVESLLNITQDHMVTTNEIVSENVVEIVDVNETVVAGSSKNDNVDIPVSYTHLDVYKRQDQG